MEEIMLFIMKGFGVFVVAVLAIISLLVIFTVVFLIRYVHTKLNEEKLTTWIEDETVVEKGDGEE